MATLEGIKKSLNRVNLLPLCGGNNLAVCQGKLTFRVRREHGVACCMVPKKENTKIS